MSSPGGCSVYVLIILEAAKSEVKVQRGWDLGRAVFWLDGCFLTVSSWQSRERGDPCGTPSDKDTSPFQLLPHPLTSLNLIVSL